MNLVSHLTKIHAIQATVERLFETSARRRLLIACRGVKGQRRVPGMDNAHEEVPFAWPRWPTNQADWNGDGGSRRLLPSIHAHAAGNH